VRLSLNIPLHMGENYKAVPQSSLLKAQGRIKQTGDPQGNMEESNTYL